VTAAPTANLKFKRTRIVLEDEDLVRPLLGLGASADGGLILDLSSSTPATRYRYGVVDLPAGQGSFQAAIRKDEASWSDSVPPKLHYHRSGLISLSATRKLERQGIQATPIGAVGPGHKHCFSFVARYPFAWKRVAPRPTDLRFATSQPPTTITVAGFIGPLDNLVQESQPENPWAITVQEDDGTMVPTVVARLDIQDPRYYVWIQLYPDRPFGSGPDPEVILYAFDPASIPGTRTAMVGVWSVARERP
jgi:hypothetical protein